MATDRFRFEHVSDGEEIERMAGEEIVHTEMVDTGTLGVWLRATASEPLPDDLRETDNLEI